MTQNVRDEESEKVKILDNTANGLLQNENKLAEIGNNLNQSEPAVLAEKLKQIEADLVKKEEQIGNLQQEQEKEGSKRLSKAISFDNDFIKLKHFFVYHCRPSTQAEYKELKQEKQIKSLQAENHSLKHDLECLTTQYEGLVQKNTELKRKVAFLRNEMELVNTSRLRDADKLKLAETKNLSKRRDSGQSSKYFNSELDRETHTKSGELAIPYLNQSLY